MLALRTVFGVTRHGTADRLRSFHLLRNPLLAIVPARWRGGIAQLVERLVRNEKARGSNPLTSSPESFRGCHAE